MFVVLCFWIIIMDPYSHVTVATARMPVHLREELATLSPKRVGERRKFLLPEEFEFVLSDSRNPTSYEPFIQPVHLGNWREMLKRHPRFKDDAGFTSDSDSESSHDDDTSSASSHQQVTPSVRGTTPPVEPTSGRPFTSREEILAMFPEFMSLLSRETEEQILERTRANLERRSELSRSRRDELATIMRVTNELCSPSATGLGSLLESPSATQANVCGPRVNANLNTIRPARMVREMSSPPNPLPVLSADARALMSSRDLRMYDELRDRFSRTLSDVE